MYPIVTIVGRPNVGKSMLFNRLVGQRHAVVSDVAGTTRDRVSKITHIGRHKAMLVDTGGLTIDGDDEDIESNVKMQAKIAINESDCILFVIDGRQDLTTDDYHVIELLRKSHKKVTFIANKCDTPNIKEGLTNIYSLGFGEPHFISGLHNIGIEDLIADINNDLHKGGFDYFDPEKEPEKKGINVCFLGKPNVGKSSIINAIVGEERLIVSDVAGTTRDATDTELEYEDQHFTLIDTAGIRRRGKIEKGIEKYSVLRSMQSVKRSDIAILMLDYTERLAKQDCHLAGMIQDEAKGLIIVVNKIDTMEIAEEERNRFVRLLRRKFPFLPWAPYIFVSAKTKKNVFDMFPLIKEIYKERNKVITQKKLDLFLKKVLLVHPPPRGKEKVEYKLLELEQVGIEPPSFHFSTNKSHDPHFSYKRFLENAIRKEFGFSGTGISITFGKQKRGKKKKISLLVTAEA